MGGMDHGRDEWADDTGVWVDGTNVLVHRLEEWAGGNVSEVTEVAVFIILISATVWETAGVMFFGELGVPVVTSGSKTMSSS